jgi:XTP/dITP diphosphohydrolase
MAGLALDLVALTDRPEWRAIVPPEETGRTFGENARLKARYYASATGLLTVAEDSGLEIDALQGAPGVESARFGGVESSYLEKFALIREALAARGATDSPARFVCAIALAEPSAHGRPPAVVFETLGVIEGRIAQEPRGEGGFGYDPISYYPPFDCTLAEAGERKSTVSHRGAAFRSLRAFLESNEAGR